MDKIFEKANDQHVRNFVVFGKTADHKLYYESTYKTQVTQADLEEIFKKGALLIYDGTSYIIPVELAANKVKTVGGSSTAATLVEWTAAAE